MRRRIARSGLRYVTWRRKEKKTTTFANEEKTYAKWENETEKKIEWTHKYSWLWLHAEETESGWTRRVKLIGLASLFRNIDWLSSYRGYRRYGLTIHIQFSFITSGFNPRIIKINPILPFENLYPISSLISNILKILEKLEQFPHSVQYSVMCSGPQLIIRDLKDLHVVSWDCNDRVEGEKTKTCYG